MDLDLDPEIFQRIVKIVGKGIFLMFRIKKSEIFKIKGTNNYDKFQMPNGEIMMIFIILNHI